MQAGKTEEEGMKQQQRMKSMTRKIKAKGRMCAKLAAGKEEG